MRSVVRCKRCDVGLLVSESGDLCWCCSLPFKPGDRVRFLTFNEPMMTVRDVTLVGDYPTHLWQVQCCWFGPDLRLQQACFDAGELAPSGEQP